MTKTVTVKEGKYLYIELPEEFGYDEGTKFSVEVVDGKLILTPYDFLELNLDELPRDVLEGLIVESVEKDISVNVVIENLLTSYIENEKY